jgi:hypothetical protein
MCPKDYCCTSNLTSGRLSRLGWSGLHNSLNSNKRRAPLAARQERRLRKNECDACKDPMPHRTRGHLIGILPELSAERKRVPIERVGTGSWLWTRAKRRAQKRQALFWSSSGLTSALSCSRTITVPASLTSRRNGCGCQLQCSVRQQGLNEACHCWQLVTPAV